MTWAQWLASLPEAQREDAEERAGILEFMAGLPRHEAERITMNANRVRGTAHVGR